MFDKFCGASARTNGHKPCRQPAMANGRCRLHGGKCRGATTEEGRKKLVEVNTKHGRYTKEAIAQRKAMRELMAACKKGLADPALMF